ncbi:MAG: molecular chaperone TorD family protein, partial [Gemmatimonadetes bacterium]|nr:molecular chaperone TorD family protein [Gemmatimonadota bacterium]
MNDTTEGLLSRAAIFHLSATGLAYPGAALKARLLDTLTRMAPRDAGIAPALDRLAQAWAAVDEDALIEEYSRLFIGSDAVVLHETAYSNTGRSAELADISGFYLAFGFDL